MRKLWLIVLAGLLTAQSATGQRIRRIDVTPAVGVSISMTELPDSFRIGDKTILPRVGLNDALVIGGHVNVWLSPWIALEASGMFTPTALHGYSAPNSVDISAFTLGARVAKTTGKFRPYVGAGFGAKRYDFFDDAAGSVSHFASAVSVGAFTELAPEIRIRAEARDLMSVFASETSAASRVQHDLVATIAIDLALMRRSVAVARR